MLLYDVHIINLFNILIAHIVTHFLFFLLYYPNIIIIFYFVIFYYLSNNFAIATFACYIALMYNLFLVTSYLGLYYFIFDSYHTVDICIIIIILCIFIACRMSIFIR